MWINLVRASQYLRLGCELAQGYDGIAKPMPASEIPEWINDWQPDDNWQRALPHYN